MLIADKLSHHQQKHCPDDIKNANNFAKTSSDGDLALVIAADQIGKGTCLSMQKLLTLVRNSGLLFVDYDRALLIRLLLSTSDTGT